MADHEDYAHIKDPQTERTKWELWAIVAIVVVVVFGGIVWRAVTDHPGKPQTNWNRNATSSAARTGEQTTSAPAAAAYAMPH